jgi:hypothetical protein
MRDVVGTEDRAPPKLWHTMYKNAMFSSRFRSFLSMIGAGTVATRTVHMTGLYCSIPNIAGVLRFNQVSTFRLCFFSCGDFKFSYFSSVG